MRIIAGTARSLPLQTIEGMNTRPTTDKIKETLFNMLQGDILDAYFLDLFAGSGQIGLEAISRGAAYSVFVENNRKAAKCIENNIHFTKFDAQCRLYRTDALAALRSMEGCFQFDIIFMDPPYNMEFEKKILTYLSDSSLLKDDTLIITEASLQTDFSYAGSLGYQQLKYKKYRNNAHVFFTRRQEDA